MFYIEIGSSIEYILIFLLSYGVIELLLKFSFFYSGFSKKFGVNKQYLIYSISITNIMYLSDIEYLALRFIRKFFFTTQLLIKIGKLIPYYKTNIGFAEPEKIATEYIKYCQEESIDIEKKNILEIGTGAINSIAYEMCGRINVNKYYSFEPFIRFDETKDHQYLSIATTKYCKDFPAFHQRINSLHCLKEKSIDVIFSHSVLEHVNDLEQLIMDLKKYIKPNGTMIHVVDYRDHFFKYPFHFLLYSKKTWNKYLNPGDLPRWRISDHVNHFKKQGFNTLVLHQEFNEQKFNKIKSRIHSEFSTYPENDLKTVSGVILVK